MMVIQGTVIENSGAIILARVENATAGYITIATTSSITAKVFNRATEALIASPTVVVASSVYDTLQTGNGWAVDDTGWNLRVALAGSNFPEGDTDYRVELKITPSSGNATYVIANVHTENIYSE